MTEEALSMSDIQTNESSRSLTSTPEVGALPNKEQISPIPAQLDIPSALNYLETEVMANGHNYFIVVNRALPAEPGKPDDKIRMSSTAFNPWQLVDPDRNLSEWAEFTSNVVSIDVHVNTKSTDNKVDWAGGADARAHPDSGYQDSRGNVYERKTIQTGIDESDPKKRAESPLALATRWNLFKEKVTKVQAQLQKVESWLRSNNRTIGKSDYDILPKIVQEVRKVQVQDFMARLADAQTRKAQEKYGNLENWRIKVLRGAENIGFAK